MQQEEEKEEESFFGRHNLDNTMRFCFPPCLMKRFPAKTGGGVDCYLIIMDGGGGGRRWPAAWISWTLERVYVYRQVLYKGCCKYSGIERHGILPSLFLRRLRYTTTAETAETTTTTIRKRDNIFPFISFGFFFFRGVHGPKPGTKKNEPKFLGSVEQSKSEIIGHRCTGTNRLYGCCYKYFTPYNRPEKKKLKIKVQLS